ncbi:Patellin-3 [Vitis vinifera]|uniref:Patellin-3 n=1 Tax=Vitis vinifera TaxID=29760 RepID=A0A438CEB2_VITVI|nr:Patellin-3 [Vitis vinifera]
MLAATPSRPGCVTEELQGSSTLCRVVAEPHRYEKTFSDEEKRMKFLRWRIQFLERSIRKLDFTPGGVNTIFQVNDLKNSPGPGKWELRQATKQALQLLQDNYPEFVAKQVFINVPWCQICQTLFKYISPEQVPMQYGGLSVDYCDCNPDFGIADPVTEITVKPSTKQTVEILVSEAMRYCMGEGNKMAPTDDPVMCNSSKIKQLRDDLKDMAFEMNSLMEELKVVRKESLMRSLWLRIRDCRSGTHLFIFAHSLYMLLILICA